MSGSFLLAAVLLAFAFGAVPPEKVMRLAIVGAAVLSVHPLLSTQALRAALGPFADPLHLTAGLFFLLTAMALTGGAASDLYPLLLVDVALACALLGVGAGRFLAVATVSGLLILAALTAMTGTTSPFGLALRALAPAALLVAFEVGARRGNTTVAAATEQPPAVGRSSRGILASQLNDIPQLLHDLRSPLTVARLYADMMAEQARRGEPAVVDHIENLRAELGLAESLLDPEQATRRSVPAGERTDVVKMLGELAASYRAAHAPRVRIEFIAEQPELPVFADSLSLRRAFRNVLDNAVKYTPVAGQVKIRAGEDEGRAFVIVSDTGVGMNAAEQERAFDNSFRGEAARWVAAGHGLGLGITRELLKAQGGTITLDSRVGRGSDVTIRLPLAERVR